MSPLSPGGRDPVDLRALLLAALETLPPDRIPTAEELAGALAEAQARSQAPASDPEPEAPPADETAWDEAGLQGRRSLRGPLYEPLEEPVAPPRAAAPEGSLLFRLALIAAAVLVLLVFVRGFWNMEEQKPAAPQRAAAPLTAARPAAKPAPAPRPAETPSLLEMVDDASPAEEEPEPMSAPAIEEEPEVAQAAPALSPPAPPASPAPAPPPAVARRVFHSWEEENQPADLLKPGPGVEEPVPLDLPRFAYPAEAHGTGPVDVRLALLVDERGRVIDARVREGVPPDLGFEETALAVARRIPFQPATRYDVPGKMWTEMILEFVE